MSFDSSVSGRVLFWFRRAGKLPPELAKLVHLEELCLPGNKLFGEPTVNLWLSSPHTIFSHDSKERPSLDVYNTGTRQDVAPQHVPWCSENAMFTPVARFSPRPENREGTPVGVGSPVPTSGGAPGQQLHG